MARSLHPGPSRLRRELAVFIGVGLIVLIAILLGAVFVIGQVAQRQALADDEVMTSKLGEFVVAPVIADILDADTEKRRELDRLIALRIQEGSITEVNVWSLEGQILYSDDRKSIGRRFEPPAEVVAAIRDGRISSTVETEPETGPGSEPRQVEVYAPLVLPDRTLAFEAYYSYRSVQDQTDRLALQIVPLVVGPLVLLQLVQVPIAVSLARRLRRHETDRAQWLERTLSASDRERKEIAADLHDGVVQDLAGVGYAVGALSRCVPEEHRAIADRIGVVVRGAVDTLRRLMVDIYPPDLSGCGLADAIVGLTGPLRDGGLNVEVDVEPLPAMDPGAAATLYRTARETLTNIIKHADAASVQVRLGPDTDPRWPGGTGVRLTVSDDGNGIPATWRDRRKDGHLGLRMMVDRLADIDGELTIEPGPSGGTVVDARVPAVGTGSHGDNPPDRGGRRPPRGVSTPT